MRENTFRPVQYLRTTESCNQWKRRPSICRDGAVPQIPFTVHRFLLPPHPPPQLLKPLLAHHQEPRLARRRLANHQEPLVVPRHGGERDRSRRREGTKREMRLLGSHGESRRSDHRRRDQLVLVVAIEELLPAP